MKIQLSRSSMLAMQMAETTVRHIVREHRKDPDKRVLLGQVDIMVGISSPSNEARRIIGIAGVCNPEYPDFFSFNCECRIDCSQQIPLPISVTMLDMADIHGNWDSEWDPLVIKKREDELVVL